MALILGVTHKSTFYIHDTPVRVVKTEGPTRITVEVEGNTFIITDKEAVEIYPQVFVSAGVSPTKGEAASHRLVIEAPRSITILRQELYEQGRKPRVSDPS